VFQQTVGLLKILILDFDRGRVFSEGGLHEKNVKNSSRICLYGFLLRFYESDKVFFGGGGAQDLKRAKPCLYIYSL